MKKTLSLLEEKRKTLSNESSPDEQLDSRDNRLDTHETITGLVIIPRKQMKEMKGKCLLVR